MVVRTPDGLETPMVIGKPAPFVSAFVEAVDDAIHEHHPSHTMSATQRAWLAFCVTAVLVTNSIQKPAEDHGRQSVGECQKLKRITSFTPVRKGR